MALIFNPIPGEAISIRSDDATPIEFRLTGWGGFQAVKSVVTQVGIDRNGNFQIMPTLTDFSYFYSFGEKISELRISGVSFSQLCGRAGPTGIELVHAYYEAFRSSKTKAPVQLQMGVGGDGLFEGLLTNCRLDISRPDMRLDNFGLIIQIFPRG